MRTRSLPAKLAALGVAGAFFLAACGSDSDDSSDNSSETTEAEATETTEAEGSEASGETIVDLAVATEDLSTLVEAVTAAELGETLSSEGPFTVFAPTNDAFAALPDGTLDTLLEDPTGDLASILTYHVVAGEVLSSDLTDGQVVETVNGESLTINVGDTVTITDAAGGTATVTTADVEGSNGVVHIIDAVLLPA